MSISDMPTIKYWKILGSMMDKAKEKIPKQFKIGDTCFTSLATIGVDLFTRHPKNCNHAQKYSKDLMSVIIILGTNFHGGKKIYYYEEKMNNIEKIAHVLKHSHGRCVVGPFDKILNEGSIWTFHRDFLSFTPHK